MRWFAVTLLALALAGCSESGKDVPEDDPFEDLTGTVESDEGIIRGVVIDEAIRPVEGAKVRVDRGGVEAMTNAEGAFVLEDLEPGVHFFTVSKPGYSTVQASTEVVAGVKSPPIVKVQVQRMPGTEPRAVTLSADGFIACGIGTPATFHVCPGLSEDKSTVTIGFEGAPSVVQVETTWKSTQALGEQLYLVYYFCQDNCGQRGDRWDEGNRDNPWIARTDGQNRTSMDVAIYASPGGPANGTGFAFEQTFHVYSTFFYNIAEPDPDWTFMGDGEYPAGG